MASGASRLGAAELDRRADAARERLRSCDLCANRCRVDRLSGEAPGVCRTGARAVVGSWGAHHGEEDPLRGSRGSGTVFFAWCNLRCDFCQNWDLSRAGRGREMEPAELAGVFLELQDEGCHNLNLVSPSHVVAPVLSALALAVRKGFALPVVYNTGGYDSLEALALLDGVVDVYMPDMKYGDEATARRLSHVPDYPAVNRAAVREMHRQVGDLVLDGRGLAVQGLLVRHLVLPGGLAGTEAVVSFLAREVSRATYLNLMGQYHPAYRAADHPPLDRPVSRDEVAAAHAFAARHGLRRLDRPRPAALLWT